MRAITYLTIFIILIAAIVFFSYLAVSLSDSVQGLVQELSQLGVTF